MKKYTRERVFYEVPQGSQAGEIRNMCDDNGEEMGSQRGRDRAPQVKPGDAQEERPSLPFLKTIRC